MNLFDLLPSIRDQGERDTCLSLALTDGHQVARRSRQALSAEYLHFQASKRAGVELNQGVPVWAGRRALSADGQPAEDACTYSAKARPVGWQLPPVSPFCGGAKPISTRIAPLSRFDIALSVVGLVSR